jgi:hypothetical protein
VAAYSTLAAVVVAGLGYWYTVIPLYQKAAVDEQLAKRETELKQLDLDLVRTRREAYELVRASLLEQTALRASYDCAAYWREANGTPIDQISRSLAPCLAKASESIVATKRLNEEDSQTLTRATLEFSKTLEQRRLTTLERIKSVPTKAASDPTVLAPEGPYAAKVQEFLAKADPYLRPEDRATREQKRHENRVSHTQFVVASDFGVEASTAIVKFYRSGIWPAVELTK